jgi:dTDP-glucose 4,6-dehydratase
MISKSILNLLNNISIPIYGNGHNIRDWIYVSDNCDAIFNILLKGKVGQSYNIGGNCELSNLELVKIICNLMGKDFYLMTAFVEDRKSHDLRYSLDCSKIQKELNWKPKIKLIDGLTKTIEWYKNFYGTSI